MLDDGENQSMPNVTCRTVKELHISNISLLIINGVKLSIQGVVSNFKKIYIITENCLKYL